jgi:hypothetical protein
MLRRKMREKIRSGISRESEGGRRVNEKLKTNNPEKEKSMNSMDFEDSWRRRKES